MGESSSAVDEIVKFVINVVSEKVKNIPRDRTVFAKVTQLLGNNKYKVEYAGKAYSAFSIFDTSYIVGDIVVVTFMEGSTENIVIMGKRI